MEERSDIKPVYKHWSFWLAIIIGIYFIYYQINLPSKEEIAKENAIINAQANRERDDKKKEADRKHAFLTAYQKDLVITNETWRKGGFNSVAIHSFNIKNLSKDNIYKDITVRFHYIGQSGTEISQHDETIYRAVAKQKPMKVRELNAGFINSEVHSVRSEIVGATNLGFYY